MPSPKIVTDFTGTKKVICAASHLPLDNAFLFRGQAFLNYILALVHFVSLAKDDKSKEKVFDDISSMIGVKKEALKDTIEISDETSVVNLDYTKPPTGRVSAEELEAKLQSEKKEKESQKKEKKNPEYFVYTLPSKAGVCASEEIVEKGQGFSIGVDILKESIVLKDKNNLRVLVFHAGEGRENKGAESLLEEVSGSSLGALFGDVVLLSPKKLSFIVTDEQQVGEAMDAEEVKDKQKKARKKAEPKEPKAPKEKKERKRKAPEEKEPKEPKEPKEKKKKKEKKDE